MNKKTKCNYKFSCIYVKMASRIVEGRKITPLSCLLAILQDLIYIYETFDQYACLFL